MEIDRNHPVVVEQHPINQALAQGLVQCVPASWQAAELRVGFVTDQGPVTKEVVNPDTGETETVPEDLAALVFRLEMHRRKYGLTWQSGVYGARREESGQWAISASFE